VNPDDIYLAYFPFGDTAGMKLRPVLLLTKQIGSVPEALVAYISSVVPSVLLASDIVVDPANSRCASTNLKTRSVLRLHKLATIHASSIVRHLGNLPSTVAQEVDMKLKTLLEL
jgi:mRNA interferase MazF